MRADFEASKSPEEARALAEMALRPSANATAVVAAYGQAVFGELDLRGLSDCMSADLVRLRGGDSSDIEAMLFSQATALQSIFSNLARRAAKQEYLKQWESLLRMGLKAQAQSRSTLETLALVRNPRSVAFVKQANISNGPQQVNNGPVPERPMQQGSPSRTRTQDGGQNELMELQERERLDRRATGKAVSGNPSLEALDEVDGPEDNGW